MNKYLKLGLLLFGIIALYLLSVASYQGKNAKAYHAPEEINFFRGNAIELPLSDNGYFKASGNCDGCHGLGETMFANTINGNHDVSPVTYWRGTMMANSAKDPLWKAKVSHEVAVNPAHKEALEDKCTTCHAPMGKFSHDEFNLGPYGMDDLETDSMGQDGVSCLACHKQSTENLGNENSGVLHFIGAPVAYGPFGKPFEAPMQDLAGILPVYSEHINDAGVCAGCHSLITNSVDLDGNFTGETFVEQATYHEWLNSAYDDDQANATTCQGCHMPRIEDEVVISANYPALLFPREPYALHELVGGNSFMLKILKQNATTLGIAASDEVMDSTIARTNRMLQQQTMNLDLSFSTFNNDTGYFELRLENLAGHKFPSGYPSRRAFIEFVVIQDNGDTLFQSGVLQPDFEVAGHNADYEPHYNVVKQEDQVQIYEMVMGDVNNDVTTVLERAFQMKKDNRLAPLGFTTIHEVYDTTKIVGGALTDSDFNFEGFEGSGTDKVHYHVPLNGYNGTIKILSKVWYQSVPPKYLAGMFAVSTPEIAAFQAMYNAADKAPVLIASDSIINVNVVTGIEDSELIRFDVYPNPTTDGIVNVSGSSFTGITAINVYAVDGRLVSSYAAYPGGGIQLPAKSGIYHIQLDGDFGSKLIKLIRN